MYAKEAIAGDMGNNIIIIPNEKYKLRKRPRQRINRLLLRVKMILPFYWYDHLLDELEIDLREFN